MARVLIAEKIADTGLDLLREAGHDVDVKLGLTPDELIEELKTANGLVIRSSTQVTAEALAQVNQLF